MTEKGKDKDSEKINIVQLPELICFNSLGIAWLSTNLLRASQLSLFTFEVLGRDKTGKFLEIEIHWTDDSKNKMSQTEWISADELQNLEKQTKK